MYLQLIGVSTAYYRYELPKQERGATMRTELLRFNGAVERDPAIDAWMNAYFGDGERRDQHITLYTGYTLEDLATRNEQTVRQILELTDILIDGPFVKELSDNAQEWLGSTNQRIVYHPALYLSIDRAE
jgi:hypothetical protein